MDFFTWLGTAQTKCTDGLASVQVFVPDGIKIEPSLGTGLIDGSLRGIGGINELLSRDKVKFAGFKPSAPV